MTTFSSQYQIIDTLHENLSTVVYRANYIPTKESVIIKMLKANAHDDHNIAQFVNEYQILSTLKSSRIVKLIDAVDIRSRYIHIFEDIGGNSLFNLLQEGCFPLKESLEIAWNVADTIRYLHQKHIIHADINPKNIIYNPETKALQIIDFGYSIYDNNYRFNNDINVGTSGNLLYMSPEQTGRTKQKIDHRTDFYSFGMTLYHLFSGRLPFDAKDRYELIHKQIALSPVPLHELNGSIPAVLSRMVEKLIDKQPDRRYQSDDAILYDLKQCTRLLKHSDEIDDFIIATQDRPIFKFGEHLFGRGQEILLLKQAADKVLSGNDSVKILVYGNSGVGKTRLIEEFFTYINTGGLRIFRGKFEQYQIASPYQVFKQIFAQFHIYLRNNRQENKEFKIHPNSIQVLCQVFPELCEMFSFAFKQPSHSAEEIKNQLPYALEDFFNHVVTAASPMILFMDDLQWADPASIELIQKAILEVHNPNLHFIASYRDDEIKGIAKLIDAMRDATRYEYYNLHLIPLNEHDIHAILADFLRDESENSQKLASLIYKKTNGNPFYVKTFLYYLIDTNGLAYENGTWVYSLDQIKAYSASINMVSIINAKFSLLSAEEQLYLQHLALLGNRFDLKLTSAVMDFLGQPNYLLEDLETKGFIELLGREYQFVHDQIHQFVFASIADDVKKRIHRDIGKYLERTFAGKKNSDMIAITHHLNNAYDLNELPSRLFKLNVKALEEMIINNAYALAMEHVRWIDAHLYREALWENERVLTFQYHVLKGKTLYLNAFHSDAYQHAVLLMTKAKNVEKKLTCFTLLKNICVTQGSHFNELIDFGNDLFKELGLQIPTGPNELYATVGKLDQKIKKHPLYRTPEEILKLPRLQNPHKQKILALLVDYWEAAFYLADIELMQWAYLNIIDLSFRFGNSSESSFGYVLYGAWMVSQREYVQGYRFGEVSLKLNHMICDHIMLPKVHNFFANFINPYIKPVSSNIALYQKSLQQSKMNGDIVFGTWANFLMHFSDYLSGKSLENLRENIGKEQSFILNSGDTKMIAIFNVLTNTVRSLQEGDDSALEEQNAIALWESEDFYPGLAWYGILKAQTCFIEGEWKKAYKFLERFVHSSANEVIMFPKIRLHFLRALLLLNKTLPLSDAETEQLQGDLFECDSYIKAASVKYRFWKLLLKAERMKLAENHWSVAKVYDDALKEARKSKNPFAIAMGGVCAGRFWKRFSYTEMSHIYFNEAIVGLRQWGAYEAAKRLKEKYLTQETPLSGMMESSSNSSLIKSEPANFQSLLKSFQAISQVMDTDELVTTLLKIILENATASRAVLMFKDREYFFKSASIDFKNGEIEFFNKPLEEAIHIPQHIIFHAINRKKNITLENPAESGIFQYDEYIRHHKPASCFVLPALIEGSVEGVLYLENRDVMTPLSPDTVQTLRLLLTQSAIIFKNASLYESLKINEKNLNKAQQISHIGSWQYNRTTDEIQWSAETYRIYELEPFEIAIDNDWFMNHILPEDVTIVLDAYENAISGQRYYDVTHRIVTAKGNIRFVHQRAEIFWDNEHQKMSGTIQDITKSKKAEEQISRLSQVVDQNPYSTIITDKYGFVEYVNTQCLNMTGYFEHELLHHNMNIFRSGVHSDSFYHELWNTISREKTIWRGTLINRMKNGANRDCESTIFPIFNGQNEIVNFVTIQEDVTERNIKDKLFLMQTRQAQMGEMLSMIAHQWRQPLTIMSALLSRERINILLQKSSMDDIVESYDAMELQIQYLSRTITDFRDFFKPDKQAVVTNSGTIFSKTLSLIEHSLINAKIAVHQTHQNDHEYKTYENELVQVMLNLLKNAQDVFEERHTVYPELNIVTDQCDGDVIISVEDNAGGIDPILMDTIFLPYVSTKHHLGTGLGLYMCKTVVENHCHGTIRIENTQKGAKFIIRIPMPDGIKIIN